MNSNNILGKLQVCIDEKKLHDCETHARYCEIIWISTCVVYKLKGLTV